MLHIYDLVLCLLVLTQVLNAKFNYQMLFVNPIHTYPSRKEAFFLSESNSLWFVGRAGAKEEAKF